jgi:hypothetical protein
VLVIIPFICHLSPIPVYYSSNIRHTDGIFESVPLLLAIKNPESDPLGVDLESTRALGINLVCSFPFQETDFLPGTCRVRYYIVCLDHSETDAVDLAGRILARAMI